MMRRSCRLAPLALAALSVLAGCQDYNFSPVNQCLIQPGTERVTLSDISTADILFVVDDSGSMGGKQQSLQDSFGAFIANLQATNETRVQNGLEPIDFHIAITTTAVFLDRPTGAACAANCGGAAGLLCCDPYSNQPLRAPRACKADADCAATSGGPYTCQAVNQLAAPERTCVNGTGQLLQDPVGCSTVGAACGAIQSRYQYTHGPRSCGSNRDCRNGDTCRTGCTSAPTSGSYCCNAAGAIDQLQCNPGASTGEFSLYPRGDFVKAPDAASPVGPKPRVIHFTKDLFCTRTPDGSACACLGAGAPTTCDPPVVNTAELARRSEWFKANVEVGTCGSGQEQGFEAARRALKKALHVDGLSQPPESDGSAPAWPHANSKLVTVWVGDEDDCSTPESPTQGVILTASDYPDACVLDGRLPADQQKRYPVDEFTSFFNGLGRPLATGFIVSALANDCVDAACQSGGEATCTDPTCTSGPGLCGGQAPGTRFIELGQSFSTTGNEVVTGSICHPSAIPGNPPDFSTILDRVADVVKQPTGLQLPTQPATAGLTILRIVGTDGKTRKTCSAPAPVGTTGAALDAYDWWFTDGNDLNKQVPTGASRFIAINQAVLRCTANPGETYSADYLGLVPAPDGCATATDCEVALGARDTPWVCEKEAGAPASSRGTCICGG
jgi:hypothetical protein